MGCKRKPQPVFGWGLADGATRERFSPRCADYTFDNGFGFRGVPVVPGFNFSFAGVAFGPFHFFKQIVETSDKVNYKWFAGLFRYNASYF